MKQLPIIRIEGIEYFIDERLQEIREVNNPHNSEHVSIEVLEYWKTHNVTEL